MNYILKECGLLLTMFKKSERAEMEPEDEKSARVPMSKRKRKLEVAMLDVGPSVKKR